MLMKTQQGVAVHVIFGPNGPTGLIGCRKGQSYADCALTPESDRQRNWLLTVEDIDGTPLVKLSATKAGLVPVFPHDYNALLREMFGETQAIAWLNALKAVVA